MDSLTPASTRQIANISCSAIYPNNNNDNNNIKSSSALSRKDYPLRPGLSSLGSKSFDSNQAVVEGNEADTETTSTIRHRKRRNSTTLRSTHQSAIKKVTSPATSSTRQVHLRPSTSGGLHSPASNFSSVAQSPSYSAFKPSRNNESRSPPVRRPPASRSSHGVATSAGPPPAISTQRVFSFESLRLPIGDESAEPTRLTPKALAELDATSRVDQDLKQVISTDYIQPSRGRSTQPKPIETQSGKAIELKSNTETEFRMDRTNKRYSVDGGRTAIQRSNAQPNYNHMALQDSLSNGSSHEDLFLNMAQVVGAVEWEQEPKSRIALPPHRSSLSKAKNAEQRPITSHGRRSSLTRPDFATNFRTPSSERITSRERKYASTAHPLDGRQTSRLSQRSPTARRNEAYIESPSIRKSETPSVYHSRFRSAHLPSSTNAFNSPILNPRHRSLDQEPSPTQPKPTDGTESTISTTAPSTVWDELDDLKLRIRKLEGTGKIPPSSNGSMERPRTAATSATTMSSSPKINGMKSVSPTANEFDEGTPHLLLNSALSKAKAMTSPEVYRTLEATTTDALNLAKMTFPNKNSTALERQLKRKADNMCRSLTELCIALSASNLVPSERPPIRARSSSRDAIASRHFPTQQISSRETEEERRYERAQSWDPEPTNTQRVLSRLEARRTSMKIDASNIGNVQASPPTELHLELKTPTQSTVTRANTVLQRRRLRDSINADDHDTTIRPLSRAAIDLTRANTTTAVDRDRKRLSRDYTSAHPMPSPFLRQFPGLSNIPGTRRSYLTNSPATNINTNNSMLNHVAQPSKERDLPPTPSTPGSSARRYLNRSTHAGGGDDAISSRITESRQRLVSSGQYTPARSLLSTRAGDRRSFVNANPADDQEHAGQF